ncbi:erythromycin esterase family protein [Actinoplanes sp. NPDC048791]|uniref:erythromycin esterase family protein n=1 Tax=Actinoplanes sp. NPDC048791 TaxID=3154623 RepID=UPI0033FD4FAD
MTTSIRDAARPFTAEALTALVHPGTRLLGLGEPTHGVEAFPELRNELFRHLVTHEGYRSITIESDCLAGLAADAYVTDGTGSLDTALSRGFSHGFGASPANRELLRWMRAYNEERPRPERLRFYGFDGPLEVTGPAGPRPAVTALYDYLAGHLDLPWSRAHLDGLLGADGRWTDPAATVDPARSVGRSPEVRELRLIVDDLRVLLSTHAPQLTADTSADGWWSADLHARTAAGLLRYHARMADPAPTRVNALMGLRDTIMADKLAAIVGRERRRGPTLAFAGNRHLQRDKSYLHFAGLPLQWWSAGAIAGARLDGEYAFAATTFGTRGADVPPPDTLEGVLSTLPYDRAVVDPGRLAETLDRELTPRVPRDHTYLSLDPATINQLDAIVFLGTIG